MDAAVVEVGDGIFALQVKLGAFLSVMFLIYSGLALTRV